MAFGLSSVLSSRMTAPHSFSPVLYPSTTDGRHFIDPCATLMGEPPCELQTVCPLLNPNLASCYAVSLLFPCASLVQPSHCP